MLKFATKVVSTVSISLLALGLAGCSAGPMAETPTAPDSVTSDDGATSENGNDGRAFDASDDTVIRALLAAIPKAERAEWQGKNIYIHFSEGSVQDLTAGIGCLAAETVIADDELAFMVYPDGELDCSTR